MNITDIPCRRENYGGLRVSPPRYLVVHYTAVPGDTAENNGRYFSGADTGKTSAHYFVDEHRIVRSVPEEYVAYHCGANSYYHPECRNGNSIGIEICTKGEPGYYFFDPDALENAKWLLRQLMEKYGIPAERVVRHWDVTHKVCPVPFVGAGASAWEEFKGGLIVYQKLEHVPEWARTTVQKLVERDILTGDDQGNLNLSYDMTRMLVVLDRAGCLGESTKEEQKWQTD